MKPGPWVREAATLLRLPCRSLPLHRCATHLPTPQLRARCGPHVPIVGEVRVGECDRSINSKRHVPKLFEADLILALDFAQLGGDDFIAAARDVAGEQIEPGVGDSHEHLEIVGDVVWDRTKPTRSVSPSVGKLCASRGSGVGVGFASDLYCDVE